MQKLCFSTKSSHEELGGIAIFFAVEDKFNFKIYNVTAWLESTYNTHISQFLTEQMQPENEIWSINRIEKYKYFSLKIIQKMRQGDYFQMSFCFFKKLYMT